MFLWHKSEKGAEKSQEDAFSRRVAKAIPGGSLTSPNSLFIALWNQAFYFNLVTFLGQQERHQGIFCQPHIGTCLATRGKSLFLQEPVLEASYSFKKTHCPYTLLSPHTQVRH